MAGKEDPTEASTPASTDNPTEEPTEELTVELSDADLIAAVLAGETDRFRGLVERYQGQVFGYLYRHLREDKETARDLAQTVFLKAYRNLATVDRTRPLAPWLLRIAHNEGANHLRWRARHPEAGMEPAGWEDMPSPSGADPEAQLARAQEQAQVRTALNGLPEKMRAAVMLFYFEESSYGEIGEILNIPPGTVGTLVRRGRERMRSLLDPENDLEREK